jgi:primosomal protein N' (replication factor Y)
VLLFGIGTQRLEEELGGKFPQLVLGENMLRLDSDTMNTASDYAGALERFASGEVRLLLGTQMIAKGLDFPNVQLIGVINADTALSMPDFRASERTFQLVSQVAGRAGRSVNSGGKSRVIIQTVNPEHPAIVAAARHDYEGFAQGELEGRRALGLPPVTRMARVVYRDQVLERARDAADRLAGLSRGAIGTQVGYEVRGAMPCPIARIGGYHRFCVEILAPGAGQLQGLLAHLRSQGELRSDALCAVDVDPISLM